MACIPRQVTHDRTRSDQPRMAAGAKICNNHVLEILYDTGATFNLLQEKWKRLIASPVKSQKLFATVSGRSRAKLEGELGKIRATVANAQFNLISPQSVLEVLNKEEEFYFKQTCKNSQQEVYLMRETPTGDEQICKFAEGVMQGSRVMLITAEALKYLDIPVGTTLSAVGGQRKRKRRESAQRESHREATMKSVDLDMPNSGDEESLQIIVPKKARHTRAQSSDREATDKVKLFLNRLGPMSYRQLRDVIVNKRILGLDFDLSDAQQKMRDLDASFMRMHGGIRTSRKSVSKKSDPAIFQHWLTDAFQLNVVTRQGYRYVQVFLDIKTDWILYGAMRTLTEYPKIFEEFLNSVHWLRQMAQVQDSSSAGVVVYNYAKIRTAEAKSDVLEAIQKYSVVVLGDDHPSHKSEKIMQLARKAKVLIHLYSRDQSNALARLDNVMKRIARKARAALEAQMMGREFLVDAMEHVIYCLNRTPRANAGSSPLEAAFGIPPNIMMFVPHFGTLCVLKDVTRGKFTVEALFLSRRRDGSCKFYVPVDNATVCRKHFQRFETVEAFPERLAIMFQGKSVLEHVGNAGTEPSYQISKASNNKIFRHLYKNCQIDMEQDDTCTIVGWRCVKCDRLFNSLRGVKKHVTSIHVKKQSGESDAHRLPEQNLVQLHDIPRYVVEEKLPPVGETLHPADPVLYDNDNVIEVEEQSDQSDEASADSDDVDPPPKRRKRDTNKKRRNEIPVRRSTRNRKNPSKLREYHWNPPALAIQEVKRGAEYQVKLDSINLQDDGGIIAAAVEFSGEPHISEMDNFFNTSSHPRLTQDLDDVYDVFVDNKNHVWRDAVLLTCIELYEQKFSEPDSFIALALREVNERSEKAIQDKDMKRAARLYQQCLMPDQSFYDELPSNSVSASSVDAAPTLGKVVALDHAMSLLHQGTAYADLPFEYEARSSAGQAMSVQMANDHDQLFWVDRDNSDLTTHRKRRCEEIMEKLNYANRELYKAGHYGQAMRSPLRPAYQKAMEKEIKKLHTIVNREQQYAFGPFPENLDPTKVVVLRTGWAYDLKRVLDRFEAKARLVLRGDLQDHRSIPENLQSPVISNLALNLLFALAAKFKLTAYCADIKTAYLNAAFRGKDGTVYAIRTPPGCVTDTKTGLFILQSNLYGSKQGAGVFHEDVVTVLVEKCGFTQSDFHPCIFYKIYTIPPHDYIAFIGTFVDDLLALFKPVIADMVRKELKKYYMFRDEFIQMSASKESPTLFLGSLHTQDPETCIIEKSQRHRIEGMVEKYLKPSMSGIRRTQRVPVLNKDKRFLNGNNALPPSTDAARRVRNRDVVQLANQSPSAIPMLCGRETLTDEDVVDYMRGLIGLMNYIVIQGVPEVTMPLNVLARIQTNPTAQQVRIATQMVLYFDYMKDRWYRYGQPEHVLAEFPIFGFSDASFGDCPITGRSTAGYCVFYHGSLIACKSWLIRAATRSVAEAELRAMSTTCALTAYIRNWLNDEVYPFLRRTYSNTTEVLTEVRRTPVAYKSSLQGIAQQLEQHASDSLKALLGYDNSSCANNIVTRHSLQKNLRHIRVHQSYIYYEFHVKQNVVIVKVPTQLQPADVLTKVLGRAAHAFYTRVLRGEMTEADVKKFAEAAYRADFPETDIVSVTLDEEYVKLLHSTMREMAV